MHVGSYTLGNGSQSILISDCLAIIFIANGQHFTVFVLVASGTLTGGAYGQEMQTHLPKNLDSETACCCGS